MRLIVILALSTLAALAYVNFARAKEGDSVEVHDFLTNLQKSPRLHDFLWALYEELTEQKKYKSNPMYPLFKRQDVNGENQFGVLFKLQKGPATPLANPSFVQNRHQITSNPFLGALLPQRTPPSTPAPSPLPFGDQQEDHNIWVDFKLDILHRDLLLDNTEDKLGVVRLTRKETTPPCLADHNYCIQKPYYRIRHGNPHPNKLYLAWVIPFPFCHTYDLEFAAHAANLKKRSILDMITVGNEQPDFVEKFKLRETLDSAAGKAKKEQEIMEGLIKRIEQIENNYDLDYVANFSLFGQYIGSGVSADVFTLNDECQSVVCKRMRREMKSQVDVETVINSVSLYTSLCEENFPDILTPTIYLWIHNKNKQAVILYSLQKLIEKKLFISAIFDDPSTAIDRKIKILERIHAADRLFTEHNEKMIEKFKDKNGGFPILQSDMNDENYILIEKREEDGTIVEDVQLIDTMPTYFSINGQMSPGNELVLDLSNAERRHNFEAMSCQPGYIALYPSFRFKRKAANAKEHYNQLVAIQRLSKLDKQNLEKVDQQKLEEAKKLSIHWSELSDKNISLLADNQTFVNKLRSLKLPSSVESDFAQRQNEELSITEFCADALLTSLQAGNVADEPNHQQPSPIASLSDKKLIVSLIDAFERLEDKINARKAQILVAKQGRVEGIDIGAHRSYQDANQPKSVKQLLMQHLGLSYYLDHNTDSQAFLGAFIFNLHHRCKIIGIDSPFTRWDDLQFIKSQIINNIPEFDTRMMLSNEKGLNFQKKDVTHLIPYSEFTTKTIFRCLVIELIPVRSGRTQFIGTLFKLNNTGEEFIENLLIKPEEIIREANTLQTMTFFMHAPLRQEVPECRLWAAAYPNKWHSHVLKTSQYHPNITPSALTQTAPNPNNSNRATFKEPVPAPNTNKVLYQRHTSKRKSNLPQDNALEPKTKIRSIFHKIDRTGVYSMPVEIEAVQLRTGVYSYSTYTLKALSWLITRLDLKQGDNEKALKELMANAGLIQ